ncbi:PREDICTED: uncharacterized protein LOC106118603 [Papilio xuthus]|uniref:Uncharacterized protein LOC106118603 n=1 Tax=Papilio xuthus TaxID=66420 RepID=A0AAJ6ZAW4_PAPXU|nr:PREDICTED: uncharacterized protein LOC106118603 [Papilio xuthus]
MEKYAHSFLQHLPVLDEETCDTQKHFVAIFSQALVEYAANNITDHISAVKEAAHNTKKLLDKSSNEVGSKLRSIISIILSIVEQPIMDIQAVCSYKVREKECSSALSSIQDARFKRCPHYSKNLAIFDGFRNLVNSCDYKQFFDRMISESYFAEPCEAIDFFIEAAAVKYNSIFQLFKTLFKNLSRQPTPCRAMVFY